MRTFILRLRATDGADLVGNIEVIATGEITPVRTEADLVDTVHRCLASALDDTGSATS